jgi:hypothetical protein
MIVAGNKSAARYEIFHPPTNPWHSPFTYNPIPLCELACYYDYFVPYERFFMVHGVRNIRALVEEKK